MTVLAPRLCPLDEQVLAALTVHVGKRAVRIAELLHGIPAWRCDTCATGGRPPLAEPTRHERRKPRPCFGCIGGEPCRGMQYPVLSTKPEQRREVREILRGLEATGYAMCRGGWWRRA